MKTRDSAASGVASISASRVARPQPHVADAAALDRRQRLGDAVDERLAADEADVGMGERLGDEMLAAAEADFEPQLARREVEQRRAGGEPRRRRLRASAEGRRSSRA